MHSADSMGSRPFCRTLTFSSRCKRGILKFPLLYLSHYLKFHRAEYYDRLMAIRNDGHWKTWLKFFLKGVGEVSRSATETDRRILELRQKHITLIRNQEVN